jgi:hypothetical protein
VLLRPAWWTNGQLWPRHRGEKTGELPGSGHGLAIAKPGHMTFPTRKLLLLLGILGAACAAVPASTAPRIVGAHAKLDGDGPGPLFVCQITRDDEDGVFRVDQLHCELPPAAAFRTVSLEVWGSGDAYLGNARLERAALDANVRGDAYPLRILADVVPTADEVSGMEAVRLRTEVVIEEAEELADLSGPELPFEIWNVSFRGEAEYAQIAFDPYTLTAEGSSLRERGVDTESVTVTLLDVVVREGDEKQLRIAVPHDTEALTGTLTLGRSEPTPLLIEGSGQRVVTARGVEDDLTPPVVAPEPQRFPLVACQGVVSIEECRLVTRTGIELGIAEVIVDGARTRLPEDGSFTPVPYGEALSGRVVIEGGIDGISLFQHGTIEGPLTAIAQDDGGAEQPLRMVLEAPFDVIHAVVNVGPTSAVVFQAETHAVELPDGSVAAGSLAASARHADADIWIAVSRGVTEVVADVRLYQGGSMETMSGFGLTSGTLVLTPEGLSPPPLAEPVDEIASCWLDGGAVHCRVSPAHELESASVSVQLEGGVGDGRLEASLLSSTDHPSLFTDLGDFFPLTIELRAKVSGADEAVQRIRVLRESDLGEATRLFIDAG